MAGATIAAAVAFLAANYLGQQATPRACQDPGPPAGNGICSVEEPHAFDSLLPDPAKLTAGFTTFDLLSQQEGSGHAKQPPLGLLEDSFLPGFAPAKLTRSTDESGEDDEEQEAELVEPRPDPKIVEERLNRILQSFLQDGRLNGKAGIDTMEFRPSDAKKGEFDRIPF